MRKTLITIMAGMLLPASFAVTSANAAIHGSPRAVVMKLNGEGFRACKSMGRSGYTGLAQGELVDGSGGGIYSEGYTKFRVRNCFETLRECERFVGRIENIVPGVSTVTLRSCERR